MKLDHRINPANLDWEARAEFASVSGREGNKQIAVLLHLGTEKLRFEVTTNRVAEYFDNLQDAIASYNQPL